MFYAVNCDVHVQAAQLAYDAFYLADFTGNLKTVYYSNDLSDYLRGATNTATLFLQDFVLHGIGAGIGNIEMVMDHNRDPGLGSLTATIPGQPFPAVLEYTWYVQVTIPALLPGNTLENYPVPTIFRSSAVTAFPPINDVFNFVEMMELVDYKRSSRSLVTIMSFPSTVHS